YAGDSLREQILLELNRKFRIYKEEDVRDKLFCVMETEEGIPKLESGIKDVIKETFSKNKIKRIFYLAPTFFVLSLSIVLISFVIYLVFKINVLNILVPLLLIPLFLEFIRKIDSATTSIARKRTLPIREAPSQFEEIFKDIISSIEADKVVIIIDNLDRCPSKTVIEMLSMIKTFMNIEKCVYVLPCDDEALIKHLKTVKGKEYLEEDAQEFLRKFFQTVIKIPPFLEEDIETFARNLNTELKYPFKESVIDVIKSAYTKNPRRIKHALNKLTTLTLLAKEKERNGVIRKGTITENLEFLAKISIIEEEWPDFYREILYNESLLEEAENYIIGDANISNKNRLKELFEKNKGLREFLNANRLITVEDIGPFLRLSQASYETISPEATTIRNCILTNDVDGLTQVLKKAENDDEKISYIKIILKILKNTHRTGRYQIRFNCLYLITEIYEQIPIQIKADVLSAFATNIDTREMMEHLGKFKPSTLFRIIKDISNKDFVLSRYVDWIIRNEKIRQDVLSQFIQNHEVVPTEAGNKLSDTLVARLSNNPDDEIAIDVIRSIASTKAKSKLLTQEVVRTLIDRIKREKNSPEQKGLDLYLKMKDIANTKNKEHFVRKQIELAAQEGENNAPSINGRIIEILSNLDDADVPPTITNEMYNEVIRLASSLNINQRVPYYLLILKHFKKLSNEIQGNFINQHLNPLFSSGDAHTIVQVLTEASRYGVPVLDHGSILDVLKQHIMNNLRDVKVVASMIKNTPQTKLDEVKDFVISLIAHNDISLSKIAAAGFAQSYEFFQENQVNAICNECLNVAQRYPLEQKVHLLDPVANAFKKCSLDVRGRFIDHLLQLLTHDDPRWWTEGRKLYNIITPHLTDDLKVRIASQTINKLNRVSDNQLPNANILFEVIIGLEKEAQREDWLVFLNILSRMILDAQPDNIKVLGLQYLEKISKLYQRSDILDQILQATKSGSPQVVEQAKRTLRSFEKR
ncbi:hypothetical protein DRP07_07590, partial [Archaeoglobales archaeon]